MSSDYEEQKDEVMVLAEIFNEKLFCFEETTRKGRLDNFTSLPESVVKVQYILPGRSPTDSTSICQSEDLQHLPPITLHFELPPDYPSKSMPQFILESIWLNDEYRKKLKAKLVDLWESNCGCVILYTWSMFLQDESLSFIGIKEVLDMSSKAYATLRSSPSAIVRELINYNKHKLEETFSEELFSCEICFESRLGKGCIRFYGCGHVYCKVCMSQYFETKIEEGVETGIICPSDNCSHETLPTQVKELVSTNLYEKYENRLMEMSIRDMDDVVRCPQRHCQVPTIVDIESNCGECPSCQFVFCTYCFFSYHGLNPCRMQLRKQRQIYDEYTNGTEAEKQMLDRRYGKKELDKIFNAVLSADYLKDNTMNCPSCNMPIEKSEGCNKMTCLKCQTIFCYICGDKLNSSNPYFHFSDVASKCANMLFDFIPLDDIDYDLIELQL